MRRAVLAAMVAACVAFLGCGESMPTVPNTPDGTVTAVASALADGKPAVLWAALPASYQKDVTGLVQQFAANMDAEVFNKGWDVVKKASEVMKQKKDFILASEMMGKAPIDKKVLAEKWDNVVGLIDTLASSQLSSLASLKSVDIGSLLTTTGGKVMNHLAEVSKLSPDDPYNKEFVATFKGVTAEKVSGDDKQAVVKITTPDKSAKDGKRSKEEKMVSVEGKWVPKEMADDWTEVMAEAKKSLDGMAKEGIAKNKDQVLKMMDAVNGTLDSMLKAEKKEDFDKALGQGMMMIMMMGMGGAPSGPAMPEPMPEPPAKTE